MIEEVIVIIEELTMWLWIGGDGSNAARSFGRSIILCALLVFALERAELM
jgi:hypothetical protein